MPPAFVHTVLVFFHIIREITMPGMSNRNVALRVGLISHPSFQKPFSQPVIVPPNTQFLYNICLAKMPTAYLPVTLSESTVMVWTPPASLTVSAGASYPFDITTSCPTLVDGSKSQIVGSVESPTVSANTTYPANQPVAVAVSYRCEYKPSIVVNANIASAASTSARTSGFESTVSSPSLTYTTTVTSKPTGDSGSPGISNRAAAGIGAGAGVAFGMVICLAAATFYFFRKRKHAAPGLAIEEKSNPSPEKSDENLMVKGSPNMVNCYLLTGASHDDLIFGLRSLGVLIEQYVEFNYHLHAVALTLDSLDESLAQLVLSENTRSRIIRLAIDPNTRHAAIRHLLACVIFSNLDIHSVGPLSLLPLAISTFILSLPKSGSDEQRPFGNQSSHCPVCLTSVNHECPT